MVTFSEFSLNHLASKGFESSGEIEDRTELALARGSSAITERRLFAFMNDSMIIFLLHDDVGVFAYTPTTYRVSIIDADFPHTSEM
jgi:hypothetical protein